MKEIGGYFELELKNGMSGYHDTPYVMKSGRASLHYILSIIKPDLVYIPYYTCNALLEPFKNDNVSYRFYKVNKFMEPENAIELKDGEYFLYINYMDIKRDTVSRLAEKYGHKLIVDNTQAFFMKGNGISWSFNSCRKFFGVPDGSYLYAPAEVRLLLPDKRNEDYLVDHLLKRFNGHTLEGYDFFVQNELLAGRGIARMSLLSHYLLSQVNYKEVIGKRRENYLYLHEYFKDINLLNPPAAGDNVPMCYPLLPEKSIDKIKLFDQKIFIATFWKDVPERNKDGFHVEKNLSECLLPLPIDHRYDKHDMLKMAGAIAEVIRN